MPIITANLCKACCYDTVNCTTVARWFKRFQEGRRSMEDDAHTCCPSTTIDNTLIEIVSMLLDKDKRMVVWETEGAYTKNNDTPRFNQIPDEEKCCRVVGTAHAVFHSETTSYGSVSETFDSLQKGKSCVFAMNNHYR